MEKYIKNKEVFDTMSERERMDGGLPYFWADPEIIGLKTKARRLVHNFNTSDPDNDQERTEIAKKLFGSIKGRVFIEPPIRVDYGHNVHLGDGILLNYGVCFLDCTKIEIGDGVLVGPNTSFFAATHPVDHEERSQFGLAKPIKVGNNVWIGGNVTICPGVTIGDRVTVAAGSVVTKDVPDDVLVGGNPARIIRHLTKS